ncbi:thioredoxin-like protein [Dactylonectria estremocensis]|uniref:Thioredoxin-like protein n=1 Tax=Dactylonectria estremocensis TaxID=1079267 RepID=A0A9P9JFP5_9HYPO|nr:thioredoxin-like protein [Dactylonectria estremocensis]
MASLSITVISDPVCPFCYIGMLRLDRALALYRKTVPGASAAPITISWHAFLLDPTAPRRFSQPLAAKMASRWGEARVPEVQGRLRDVGLRAGVVFNFDARIGSTVEAHRLVALARKIDPRGVEGLEHQVAQETMRMYFEGGGDIASTEDLVGAAARAGIDAGEARAWLESDEGLEEVQLEVDKAVGMGIKGVPRFIINDKFVVDGADDVGEFLEQLVLARDEALGENQK